MIRSCPMAERGSGISIRSPIRRRMRFQVLIIATEPGGKEVEYYLFEKMNFTRGFDGRGFRPGTARKVSPVTLAVETGCTRQFRRGTRTSRSACISSRI